MKNKKDLAVGLIMLISGIIGTVCAIVIMNWGSEIRFLGEDFLAGGFWEANEEIIRENLQRIRFRHPLSAVEISTIAVMIISLAMFIAGSVLILMFIKSNAVKRNSQENLRIIIECSVMVSVAVVLSLYTKIWRAPLGGSVTLFSMVPLIIIGLRRGVLWGYATAFVYSAAYLLLYGLGSVAGIAGISRNLIIVSSLIDYVLAYTLIGTAGFFKSFVKKAESKGKKIVIASAATLLVCVLRYAAHVIVGAAVWYEITKTQSWNEYVHTVGAWVYSIIYNLQYMLPETIITLAAVPAVVTILSVTEKQNRVKS
ncbi:MAG: energy-coupled thiamine transporter ThiT [Oscillospiraceae bacterium]|nr:energy-coupled thiamine transporter ThiT [Oscillospiraceae bacterium]